jgi:serine/threonine protein kinase
VKCLFNNEDNIINKTMVKKEIHLMQELHHPCIVQFLGFSNDHAKGDLVILMEYLVNGSLEDYVLKHNKQIPLDLKARWCHEMCEALAYLHNKTSGAVIHRDIKPSNFMLTSVLRCKLGDFGISRLFNRVPDLPPLFSEKVDEKTVVKEEEVPYKMSWSKSAEKLSSMLSMRKVSDTMLSRRVSESMLNRVAEAESDSNSDTEEMDQTGNVGTIRYMAPEVRGVAVDQQANIAGGSGSGGGGGGGGKAAMTDPLVGEADVVKSRYSVQADIFSLGMVFFFVFEAVPPHVMGAEDPDSHFAHLQSGKRPICKHAPTTVRRIIELCLRWEPNHRPTSLELIDLVEGIPLVAPQTAFGVVKLSKLTFLPVDPEKLQKYMETEAAIEMRREMGPKAKLTRTNTGELTPVSPSRQSEGAAIAALEATNEPAAAAAAVVSPLLSAGGGGLKSSAPSMAPAMMKLLNNNKEDEEWGFGSLKDSGTGDGAMTSSSPAPDEEEGDHAALEKWHLADGTFTVCHI